MGLEGEMMHSKPFLFLYLSAILLMPLLIGCGSGKHVELSGAVTYEGQPVQRGNISFLSSDGKGPTAAAIIAEGKYAVKILPGSYDVRIEGSKVVGEQLMHANNPASPKVPILEPLIPAEYNEKSTLKAEILGSTRVLDFQLKKPGGGP
jgi:hypothetical protein